MTKQIESTGQKLSIPAREAVALGRVANNLDVCADLMETLGYRLMGHEVRRLAKRVRNMKKIREGRHA